MKKWMMMAALLLAGSAADAKLALRHPTGDHMVLQQQTEAAVWGYASPGARISVTTSWDDAAYTVKADKDGHWKAMVATPEASYRKQELRISGDGGDLVVRDVLIGEVWLASGQSNMEMPVKGWPHCPVEHSADFITRAPARDRVRMLYAFKDQSDEPLEEIRHTTGWECADPVSVPEMSAVAYFFAYKLNQVLDIPVGIVAFPRGGARVESWLPRETVAGYGEDLSPEAVAARTVYTRAFEMYNAMQVPLQGYTARGFIWYQGCSNVGAHDQFVARMTDLVNRWRSDWGDTQAAMPFYMVEIAPYLYSRDGDSGALLRQAQHEAAKSIPNSAIVCTNDLVEDYEAENIHPARKEPIGNRLAYLALNRDYGYGNLACYAPEAVGASVRETADGGWEVAVDLQNCYGLDRIEKIRGLEVRYGGGDWTPVERIRTEGDRRLVIRCEGVPAGVRYGWGDFKPGNLHGGDGLPVVPFRFLFSE